MNLTLCKLIMFSLTLSLIALFFILGNIKSDSIRNQILEARQLYPFKAYKDVQLFHYTIPHQVTHAAFQYKANGSVHCSPKTIAVYLQYGSYPVMSPQNATFPDYFAVKRLFLHNITLQSNFIPVTINITNPLPGNWYAAAFLIENNDRIAQKGLFIPCSSWLSSSLKLTLTSNVITLLQQYEVSEKLIGTQIYRFYASQDSWLTLVTLTECIPNPFGKCPVLIWARQLGVPSSKPDTKSIFINCSNSENCSLKLIPAVGNWNYISIHSLIASTLQFNLNIKTEVCQKTYSSSDELIEETNSFNGSIHGDLIIGSKNSIEKDISFESPSCWPNVPLIRISLPTNLAFEYNLPPDEDDAYPFIINITNKKSTLMNFEVLPTVDIGGTLVIELAISPFMNISQNNISVNGCLAYGIRPSSEDISCLSGRALSVNTTTWEDRFSTLFVPFPESGTWYLRLETHCYTDDFDNNSILQVLCDMPYTPVFLRIRSTPCILGHCGTYGTCYQYVSGGLIFSTCNCIAGWKGWGCTDNSSASTNAELLLDVLLLTLSNLLFIPAIFLGIYRRYYTEAFVYSATMFSSAFYHACDAEVYSYCLVRLSVLQFCDFYSAILSIWVTLIAMSDLSTTVQSFVHMAGAVGVALGVEYDRTGLWVFVIPATIGLIILITSWVTKCYKKRLCYPNKRIWLFCLLPGALLAFSGLIIYAFFETKYNYPFVHSAWHATIALSVLFLLPKKKSINKSTPEPTSTCSYIRVGDINCPDGPLPTGTPYTHLLAPTP